MRYHWYDLQNRWVTICRVGNRMIYVLLMVSNRKSNIRYYITFHLVVKEREWVL